MARPSKYPDELLVGYVDLAYESSHGNVKALTCSKFSAISGQHGGEMIAEHIFRRCKAVQEKVRQLKELNEKMSPDPDNPIPIYQTVPLDQILKNCASAQTDALMAKLAPFSSSRKAYYDAMVKYHQENQQLKKQLLEKELELSTLRSRKMEMEKDLKAEHTKSRELLQLIDKYLYKEAAAMLVTDSLRREIVPEAHLNPKAASALTKPLIPGEKCDGLTSFDDQDEDLMADLAALGASAGGNRNV